MRSTILDIGLSLNKKVSLRFLVLTSILFILVFFGINTSSLGIASLQSQPKKVVEGLILGEPRQIRSDEWGHTSPYNVGAIITKGIEFESPLAIKQNITYQTLQPDNSLIDNLVLFDGFAIRSIPFLNIEQRFSLYWWFPIYVYFIGFWNLLSLIGVKRKLATFFTFFVFLAPLTQWVSYVPVRTIGYVSLGLFLLFKNNSSTSLFFKILRSTCIGVILARGALEYTPFLLMFVIPLTFCLLIRSDFRSTVRSGFFWFSLLVFTVLFSLFVAYNLESFESLKATDYPGGRRVNAEALFFGQVFGAPFYPFLSSSPVTPGSNLSELNSFYNYFFIVVLIIFLKYRIQFNSIQRNTITVLITSHATLLTWSLLNLGIWTKHIPILNLIPTSRAFQFSGILSLIALALVLSVVLVPQRLTVKLTLASFGITLLAGLSLKSTFLPTIPFALIFILSLLGALLVLLILRINSFALSGKVILLICTIPALTINPIMKGLGEVNGDIAQELRAIHSEYVDKGKYWVTNQNDTDILLMYNGIPNVSGQQFAGPNRKAWLRLAPQTTSWNIGIASVFFKFYDSKDVEVVRLQNDIVQVTIDPCELRAKGLPVSVLISDVLLSSNCLNQKYEFLWWGKERYLYEVK